MRFLSALLSLLARSTLPVGVAQKSVSYTATKSGETFAGVCVNGPPPPACSVTVSIPGFNPALGVLQGVQIQGTLSVNVTVTLLYPASNAGQFSGTYEAFGTFFSSPASGLPSFAPVASFSGTGTDCGGQTCSINMTAVGSDTESASIADITPFISAGNLSYTLKYVDGVTDCNCPGTIDWMGPYTYSQTVTYLYQPKGSSTLHNFTGAHGGKNPGNALVSDSNGVLYGTAMGGEHGIGMVYTLTPPSASVAHWTYDVIHYFSGPEGSAPNPGLMIGADGTIYGTAEGGGTNNDGTVYRMQPPASPGGTWQVEALYSFVSGAGGNQPAAVVLGSDGSLYGTATYGGTGVPGDGTAFQLSPPAGGTGPWTYTVIHSFTDSDPNPAGTIAIDASGSLYGTTAGGSTGNAFMLTRPASSGGAWTETILGALDLPGSGLTLGSDGTVYGSTYGGGSGGHGTVYQFAPPAVSGGAWTMTVLKNLSTPIGFGTLAPVVVGGDGSVYVATFYGGPKRGGTILKLSPPAVSVGSWNSSILRSFPLVGTDTTDPGAILISDSGIIYGTKSAGGTGPCKRTKHVVGCGTIYQLVP